MKKKQIVVTGLGVTSCLGNDVDVYHQKLLDGQSGISMIERFPADDLQTRFAGMVPEFDTGPYMDRKLARRADPFIRYSIVAGKKSLEYAKLTGDAFDELDKQRCGILIGSGMGGMGTFHQGVEASLKNGPRKISPFFIPFIITNMGGALLAMDLGFMGPNYSISTACATGSHCIISAANHIRQGDADLMICGGVEAACLYSGIAGFNACKALSQRNESPEQASRPWDKGRDGFVMGEGSGVVVLESREHAERRGAHIIAEYLGGAISCDAHHMTEPRSDGEGVAFCVREALKNAEVEPEAISLINAHATSTPAGDMAEIRAIKQVIKKPHSVAIHATKSMIGHGLGAAAGLEAVAIIKAIETGMVHPTINLDDPEPEILEFDVPKEAVKRDVQVVMSNAFGFGGHNATVLFGKYGG